jgi:DNA ligase (NAD+)
MFPSPGFALAPPQPAVMLLTASAVARRLSSCSSWRLGLLAKRSLRYATCDIRNAACPLAHAASRPLAITADPVFASASAGEHASPASALLRSLRARNSGNVNSACSDPAPDVSALHRALVEELRACDDCYYADTPTHRVSDELYDELLMHLLQLEGAYPTLKAANSPSSSVGHARNAPVSDVQPCRHAAVTSRSRTAHRFPPHRHVTHMLSLSNAYTPEDVTSFFARAARLQRGDNDDVDASSAASSPPDLVCCVEAKVDGIALALSYRDGNLVVAATRGDGIVGDDVTANVRAAIVGRDIPEALPERVDVDVRGEVYISPSDFAALNLADESVHLSNARNGAAGGLKSKDPHEAARRMLRFVAYDCVRITSVPSTAAESGVRIIASPYWSTQAESIRGLAAWGLTAMPDWRLCRNEVEVQSYATEIEVRRSSLPFEADGVVIKLNDSIVRDAMGNTAKAPRGAIALKFAAIGSITTIVSVAMQVSRTGSITPVANLVPVSVGGVTVTRATLHNFDEIERLGVAVGDSVVVQRCGDVIPKIKKVKDRASNGKRSKIIVPTECPSCHGCVSVTRNSEGSTTVQCACAETCAAQGLGRILHFCGRNAMDITGLGVKTAAKLLESSLLVSPSDLFMLTVDAIKQLDGFKDKSATSLYMSIRDAATNRSLERVIVGIGIPGVGRASARDLAVHAGSIRGLLALGSASRDILMRLPNVAEKSADAIHAFLTNERVIGELIGLDAAIVPRSVVDDDEGDYDIFSSSSDDSSTSEPSSAPAPVPGLNQDADIDSRYIYVNGRDEDGNQPACPSSTDLTGLSFAFTGKMELMPRPAAVKGVRRFGGKVATVVSKRTNYVVVGSDPGLKHQKAIQLGVPVISENELLLMLRNASSASASR